MVRARRVGRWLTALVVLVAAVAAVPPVALANGGPRRLVRGPAGVVLPGRETAVGVVRERLTFDFRDASPNQHLWLPRVTAEYVLANPSGQDEELEVAFFYLAGAGLPYNPEFTATWQGQEMAEQLEVFTPDQVPGTPADLGPLETHWLDPRSGEVVAVNPVDGEQLQVALFRIRVPAGEEGTLQVRYRQRDSGCDPCSHPFLAPIWHYTYLLRPARDWAFFRELTVEALTPPGMRLAAEPALAPAGDGRWEGRWPGLPEGDLHLSVRAAGIGFHPSPAEALEALLVLVAVGAAGAVLLWWRRRLQESAHRHPN